MKFVYVLSILGVLTIGLGLVAFSGPVVAMGAPVLLYCAIAILTTPKAAGFRASRLVDRSYPEDGQRVKVRVRIEADRKTLASLEDPLPRGVDPSTLEGCNAFLGTVDGVEEIEYSFVAGRGPLRFEDFACTLYGLVFAASRRVSVAAELELTCAPSVPTGAELSLVTRKTLVFAGDIHSRAPGPGEEFFMVREYRPGDRIRRINYRASADDDRLYVNEFEQRRNADVGFILDTRRVETLLPGRDTDIDALASLEFALAQNCAKRGNRLSHMTFGSPLHWVPAGYGKAQVHKIRYALSVAESSDPLTFDTIINVPDAVFPHQSVLFLFMKILGGEDRAIRALVAKRYHVVVVTRDGETERLEATESRRMNGTARMITDFEREQTLSDLRATGAIVYEWKPGSTAAEAAFGISRMIAGSQRASRIAGGA